MNIAIEPILSILIGVLILLVPAVYLIVVGVLV